jgi:hypothetical protein
MARIVLNEEVGRGGRAAVIALEIAGHQAAEVAVVHDANEKSRIRMDAAFCF